MQPYREKIPRGTPVYTQDQLDKQARLRGEIRVVPPSMRRSSNEWSELNNARTVTRMRTTVDDAQYNCDLYEPMMNTMFSD